MKTTSWRIGGLVLAALLAGRTVLAAPVPADFSALKQVPAKAPIIIHVRGVQGLTDRFLDLAKQVAPDRSGESRRTSRISSTRGQRVESCVDWPRMGRSSWSSPSCPNLATTS